MSQTELGRKAGLSARSISDYEAGRSAPTDESLLSLSTALGFPESFFGRLDPDVLAPAEVAFRALRSLTAAKRDKVIGAASMAFELMDWIEERFCLPQQDLPDLRDQSPEIAAETLRAAWGLGNRPIKNMVHLLEAKGVRVFSLVEDNREVDACSAWRGSVPFVFLNTLKSAERGRFDGGHELAHLVLHRHCEAVGREAESEADQFASALLMPADSVKACCPRRPSLEQLVALKRNWGVSVAALNYRLHSLAWSSAWHYRQMCKEIAQAGFRTEEPQPLKRESSKVLSSVFAELRKCGFTRRMIGEALSLHMSDIDALVFGLALTGVDGGRATGQPRQPSTPGQLRLVARNE